MPTDDLKVKDFWLTDFDNRAKIAEGASVVSADMQEYLVCGVLAVTNLSGREFDIETMYVVTGASPADAIKTAEKMGMNHMDSDDWEEWAWEPTSIKMLVEVEYTFL